MDLVIKNCKIVTPTNIVSAGIAIDKGKIVSISDDAILPKAKQTIDAGGKFILPGLIDEHNHLGLEIPLSTTALTETKAAALGGVTAQGIFLTRPGKTLSTIFEDHKNQFEANAVIDGFFHVNVVDEGWLNDIPNAASCGITSFKFLMGYKGPQAKMLGLPGIDDGFVLEGFRSIAELGYPARAMVHAENIDITLRLRKKLEGEGRQDVRVWHESRPNFVEEECIHRAIFLAKVAKCPLFIVHNTIGEAPDIIARAKAEGVDLLAETCPQYLTHNSEDPVPVLLENPTFAVVNPPLRGKWDNKMLWEGIKNGAIDTVGSDNAPATREQKGKDMWKSYMGTGSNTQMILPVMLSEGVNKNRISLEKVVEVCCQNPARAFGLYPRKGVINIGSDADLVIVDLEKKVQFTHNMSPALGDWTIYEDWEFTGWPVCTILRGKVIAENGKILVEPGYGQYLFRR